MADSCRKVYLDNTSFAVVGSNDKYLIEYDLVSNNGTDTVEGRVLFDGVNNALTIRGEKSTWDIVSFGGFKRLRFNCPEGVSLDGRIVSGPDLTFERCTTDSGEVIIDDADKHQSSTGSGVGTASVQIVTEPPPAGTDTQVISVMLAE